MPLIQYAFNLCGSQLVVAWLLPPPHREDVQHAQQDVDKCEQLERPRQLSRHDVLPQPVSPCVVCHQHGSVREASGSAWANSQESRIQEEQERWGGERERGREIS